MNKKYLVNLFEDLYMGYDPFEKKYTELTHLIQRPQMKEALKTVLTILKDEENLPKPIEKVKYPLPIEEYKRVQQAVWNLPKFYTKHSLEPYQNKIRESYPRAFEPWENNEKELLKRCTQWTNDWETLGKLFHAHLKELGLC